ncbi:MAG: hypothetical protein ACYCZX_08835 [Rhodospirillaceae bacterium]
MKPLSTLTLITAVAALSVSAPAMAAWDRLGSVEFSNRMDHETEYGTFGGSIEKLALEARDRPVECREVRATFGNGQTKRIFRGRLPVGRSVTIDMPGEQRTVKRIDFNCRSNSRRAATVDISADIGRYRAEWRASPDWDRMWSKMFAWAHDDRNDRRASYDRRESTGWMTLGTETFEGRRDRETTLAGFKGRQVERIGLRPTNDAARCGAMNVTFANGRSTRLNVNNGEVLPEDRIFQVDLPGDDRNVMKIDLSCRAEHGRRVTVDVMAIDPDRKVERRH